jgi:crotonobetainyl-CoA:carnitine CoA-transferase CaiB-like acyl-CoA transferase
MAARTPTTEDLTPTTAPRGPRTERGGPLSGLLVADCSTVLAGPLCTMLLGDLGADVIKVEPPEGDSSRGWAPPWIGGSTGDTTQPKVAAYFAAVNRNKRSLRLDLRDDPGRQALERLLERSDVLVENFRVGRLATLGFDDAALARLNPDLVHLSISGYGPDGPDAERPGYDFVVQAEAGLMSITGFPDGEGGHPTKVGVAISDVVTGLFGAVSVLSAVLGRERGVARGQRVDVSILESTLAVLINQAQNAFASGVGPGRLGNAHPNIVPYETFGTADGEIAIAVGSERQWPRFCEAIGLPDLVDDPRFRSNADRVTNRSVLRPLLAERFAARPSNEWLTRLGQAEVPCGPINDLLAAFASPQATAREMDMSVDHPVLGAVRQVGIPFKLSDTPARMRSAPPLLGEHSRLILEELGYAPIEIEALERDGVV